MINKSFMKEISFLLKWDKTNIQKLLSFRDDLRSDLTKEEHNKLQIRLEDMMALKKFL